MVIKLECLPDQLLVKERLPDQLLVNSLKNFDNQLKQ